MAAFGRLVPVLTYRDIAAGHDFLVRAFGFTSGGLHRDPAGVAVHGEVRAGDAAIWLHRVTAERHLDSPSSVDVANSGLLVYVDDVDAHFRHARAEGAHIDGEPVDQPYGQREYGARDLEGHRWWFAAPLKVALACLLAIALSAVSVRAQAPTRTTLDIYVVDVEGGNATLFVAPSGESLLVDTGNGGTQGAGPANAIRDAGRILAAARDAGLTRIDHLITTHWHSDHFGGMAELAKQIPIRHFIDHGPNAPDDFAHASADEFLKTYPSIYAGATHTVAKPGDRIQVGRLDVLVVASAGDMIRTSLAGAGRANPSCAAFKPGENNAEDPLSVGILVSFGTFRAAHLGDLTKNKEFELMCPTNRIGTVDVLLGLHHGVDSSNSEVLVHALRPRVAIMNNGTRKGGQPEVMRVVHSSPGLEDLWQMHFSELSGQEYTVPGMFIANVTDQPLVAMPVAPLAASPAGANVPPVPAHNGAAYWIKLSARADGSFTVTNARNGFARSYAASTPAK